MSRMKGQSQSPYLSQNPEFQEQEALFEQVCALFFAQDVFMIDHIFLQDFLIVLMSTEEKARSDKVKVL